MDFDIWRERVQFGFQGREVGIRDVANEEGFEVVTGVLQGRGTTNADLF